MTTSSKRAKADVGLVSFKDFCTLLDKIKTYRKREGKKTKKRKRQNEMIIIL